MADRNNPKPLPIGILCIASFYMLGALVLITLLFVNSSQASETVAAAHGLAASPGPGFALMIAGLAFLLAYGLISLSRWGFWLAVAYSLYLCLISLFQDGPTFAWTGRAELQIPFGNFIWSAVVLIYLFMVRRRFFRPANPGSQLPPVKPIDFTT